MKYYFDWKKNINKDELDITIDVLKSNGLVLVPTETVYGIAANACSNEACLKIFKAKNRAQDNPLIVHVSDKKMINFVAEKPSEIEEKLIDAFMPGPFTLILKKKNVICDVASCNMPTIGVRMPSNKIIHEIISKSNIPIAAPSANISGKPSGTNIDDIKKELSDKMDVIIDGGECKIGIESTVVKVDDDGVPEILRPGFITENDIKNAIGKVKLSDKLFKKVEKNEKVESPGMKYRHYAPNTKCILIKFDDNQINKVNDILKTTPNSCVLGFSEDFEKINVYKDKFINMGSKNNLNEISHNLFSSLRKIDKMNVDLAIIEGVRKENLGLSIMNRLVRAASNNVI